MGAPFGNRNAAGSHGGRRKLPKGWHYGKTRTIVISPRTKEGRNLMGSWLRYKNAKH